MVANAIHSLQEKPYSGDNPAIVFGIDVGTTFSGVSFAFQEPGAIPEIQTVTRYSGQVLGNAKVPSVLYYNKNGEVMAAGADVLKSETEVTAIEEEWTRVAYFKLHLRPKGMALQTNGLDVGGIPSFKTPVQVFGDFLKYLTDEAVTFIKESYHEGAERWDEVKERAVYVLSHPNGWQGPQQQQYREAAIHAGLIPDTADGRSRVTFISEGEASALACLASGLGPKKIERGFRFTVVDCGGGTIDLSSYTVSQSEPLQLEETTQPDCSFAGAIFVNRQARKMLEKRLEGTKYAEKEIIDQAINDEFEGKLKGHFDDEKGSKWLRLGGPRENSKELGVRGGYLKIEGSAVASCFEHSVNEAITLTKKQLEGSNDSATPVWLVGGFASSAWLLKKMQAAPDLKGSVSRPDASLLAKACAVGAVIFQLDSLVKKRFCKGSYAIEVNIKFDEDNPEHVARSEKTFVNLNGQRRLDGAMSYLAKKGTLIPDDARFSKKYWRNAKVNDDGTVEAKFTENLQRYRGSGKEPDWVDGEGGKAFATFCKITNDMSALCKNAELILGPFGDYYNLGFSIELSFGTTELQARACWEEDGQTKYGPATIAYEELGSQSNAPYSDF